MSRTLIRNADWVLTMDPSGTRCRGADILIEDREILAIGPALDPGPGPVQVIDAAGKIVTPGFVNTHHHTFQSLVRNIHIANGLKLEPWLKVVYDIFREVNADVVRAGALVGLGDLLKTGCTTSSDHMYVHPQGTERLTDVEIAAAAELGIRFHPTRGGITIGQSQGCGHVPDDLVETADAIVSDAERLIDTYHDTSRFSMCQVGLSLCWPPFETDEIVERLRDLGLKRGVQCHTHLGESQGELAISMERHGCRPVEYMRRMGWFGPSFYFAHCVQFTDEEVRLFADTGTGIAHCPNSNMFLSSGVCRVPDFLEAGAAIGLGVDGAASNNASNMMGELRNCYLVHQLKWGSRAPTAEQVLSMATAGGARVLGRDDIGYLAPGMAADLVLFDWSQFPYAGGQNDPAACIVLSGDPRMVDTVLVNGRVVVEHGRLTTVQEEETACYIRETAREMLSKAAQRQSTLLSDL